MDGDYPDARSLEAIYIESLLEKYKLSPVWQWGDNKWGSKYPNGTFNGVVGMVSLFSPTNSRVSCNQYLYSHLQKLQIQARFSDSMIFNIKNSFRISSYID